MYSLPEDELLDVRNTSKRNRIELNIDVKICAFVGSYYICVYVTVDSAQNVKFINVSSRHFYHNLL